MAGELSLLGKTFPTLCFKLVVDERVHRDDVIKPAQFGIEHIARLPEDPPMSGEGRATLASDLDKATSHIDAGDLRAAIGRG